MYISENDRVDNVDSPESREHKNIAVIGLMVGTPKGYVRLEITGATLHDYLRAYPTWEQILRPYIGRTVDTVNFSSLHVDRDQRLALLGVNDHWFVYRNNNHYGDFVVGERIDDIVFYLNDSIKHDVVPQPITLLSVYDAKRDGKYQPSMEAERKRMNAKIDTVMGTPFTYGIKYSLGDGMAIPRSCNQGRHLYVR